MKPHISPDVQLQFLRPAQIEARAKAFPVVYVPFVPIEWHGHHLPVGVDALKAHGVLCHTAAKTGGLVYPPMYLHDGWDRDNDARPTMNSLTALFQRLKWMGFRVIIGVSGHNVRGMIDMINDALAPVTEDGTVRGIGIWEISLADDPNCGTDHAAKWETADMMALYPDAVDMGALGTEPMNLDMKPPYGIGGLDPREHASAEVGQRSIDIAADSIGNKAVELLASLLEDGRAFGLEAVECDKWWIA